MNKSIRLLYCIIGSVLLIFLNHPIPHNLLNSVRYIGTELSEITDFIALIGVILTIVFSIMLIIENCMNKKDK